MADKYTQAQGLFQQGLGAAADYENQQKEALMKQAKQQYDRMLHDRDAFMGQAGNKDLPKAIRMQFYNNAAAIEKKINPNSAFPAIENWDDGVADVLDAFGAIDKDPKMDPAMKKRLKQQVITDQYRLQNDLKQTEFLQSMAFGAGTPIETKNPSGQPVLSRITPESAAVPLQAPEGQAAQKPPEPLSSDAAGRAASAQSSIKDVQQIRELLFEGGKLDRAALLTGKMNIPGTKGRQANKLMRRAIETKLRQDTGANAPPAELEEKMQSWGIQLGDNDKFAAEKLDRLEDIMGNYLFQMDPNGKLGLVPKGSGNAGATSKPKIQNLKITPKG